MTADQIIFLSYLLLVNLTAFIMMQRDKHLAKHKDARRIPENILFLSAAAGGSVGAILGMQVFRHKTKHWYFVVGMPAILIAQVAAFIWLKFGT